MKLRRFTYDLELDNPRSPVAGDLCMSARALYRITEARPVDSRLWGNRWALTCQRIGVPDDLDQHLPAVAHDGTLWRFGRYQKGQTPQQFFASTGSVDAC